MIATRAWGECACGCGGRIVDGVKFEVVDGEFVMVGHGRRKEVVVADENVVPLGDLVRLCVK